MARIPDDELVRIKAEVSLPRLVEGQGYKLTKQGKVSCPHVKPTSGVKDAPDFDQI